jgi:hypothetical protein
MPRLRIGFSSNAFFLGDEDYSYEHLSGFLCNGLRTWAMLTEFHLPLQRTHDTRQCQMCTRQKAEILSPE